MTREQALPYVSFMVDDSLNERHFGDVPGFNSIPDTARLVGWQCGFEPLFVAVWSAMDQPGDEEPFDLAEAEEIATDLLKEKRWFGDNDNPPPADYVI